MYEVITHTTLLRQRFDTKTKYETWEAAARAVEWALDYPEGLFKSELELIPVIIFSNGFSVICPKVDKDLDYLPPVYLVLRKLL